MIDRRMSGGIVDPLPVVATRLWKGRVLMDATVGRLMLGLTNVSSTVCINS